MALFKIEKGLAADLSVKRPNTVEGYCYFTTDDGKFYIDTTTGNGTSNRVCLNAHKADKLANAVTIALDGNITGSTSFDGSQNVTINVDTSTIDDAIAALQTRSITAGDGLTGGGNLTTNRTLSVGAGTGISVTANAVSLATVDNLTAGTYGPSANVSGSNNTTMNVPEITVDTYGRVTTVTNRVYTAKNTTYSNFVKSGSGAKAGLVPAPSTTAGTTKYLREDGTWQVPPDTKYTLPTASSSTLGGVKIGSNINISSGVISVPAADQDTAGVTVVYPAASCTTFSSDSGTITPLAAQKSAELFAITRPPKRSSSNPANPGEAGTCTINNIVRWLNTAGDVQDSKITIEDVTNTRDTTKKAQVISIPAEGGKKMVYGYCTDQVDGTSFIGGIFDANATTYPYSEGLAIGGTSGNLLWKGKAVATTDQIPTSLKNPNSLTVKGNGTQSFTYDGSAAKTLNIKAGTNVSVSSDTSGNITIAATDTTYSNFVKSGSGAKAGLVPAPSTTAGTTKYLREDGTWTTPPDTNTKVTSAANHYAPAEDSSYALNVDASSTTAATWNSTSLVTGVNLKRDSKGHITGLTVDSIRMPANPDTNTTYSASTGLTLSGTAFSITKANVSTILNLLDTNTSDLTANDYVITQYPGGGTTTVTYHRKPANKVVNATLVKAALGTGTGTTTFLRNDGTWVAPPNNYVNQTRSTSASYRSLLMHYTASSSYGTNPGAATNVTYYNEKISACASTGDIRATSFTGALKGNADTATQLATAQTIKLTGDVTGSASFTGNAECSISATVADDSHKHTDHLQLTAIGQAIPEAADLDTYHTGGTYYSGNSTRTGTLSNCPVSGAGFKMIVMVCYQTGRQYQFILSNNNQLWQRYYNNSSWGDWCKIWREGNSVTGAVWNDYAECRESDCEEFGYVLMENGDDTLSKTTERLSHFAGVSSDTWGFSQGETDKAKTPIAVAGRVLVYPYQDRNNYKPGDCVCAAPNGTVDIMTREEIINWPDRIVGIVSCVPDYEEWGGGENADRKPVKVNNRIWIKIK